MKTVIITARAQQLSHSVVIDGNHAHIGRVRFKFSTRSGYVDFSDVSEQFRVDIIFSTSHNRDIVKRYEDHMQAITLALGFHTYAVGRTEITLANYEPGIRPQVDVFGEYVLGCGVAMTPSRPTRPRRVVFEPEVKVTVPTSKAGLVGALIGLGIVAVVAALLSDEQ